MTQKDLIEKLVEQDYCRTKTGATAMINYIFSTITTSLSNGNEVSIPGFGKFTSETQAERSGSMNGKEWKSKAKQVPKFKASKTLKDTVA